MATEKESGTSLVNIVSTAIQIPGVRVNRNDFLREQFKKAPSAQLDLILEKGPVEAGCTRKELKNLAHKIIDKRTLVSTGASFAAGLPGGLAMAATIPADMLQYYAVALGMAQEIAYLYGEEDLWSGDVPDSEKVRNQLMLYCGVMLGASGAAQTVRVLSSKLAQQALKKLPQQALTKTFYYPIIKSIARFFGTKMTKDVFAKGVSKAVPILGGVISGGITFASMRPMGLRLADTLDEAHFDYSQDDFREDWEEIVEVVSEQKENEKEAAATPEEKPDFDTAMEKIRKAKEMLDAGIISEEEFSDIKTKLISQI